MIRFNNIAQRTFRFVMAVGLGLSLAACHDEEVYSRLSEREANEMIAVLQQAHISAHKESKDSKESAQWTLYTGEGDFARAVSVLSQQGYPHQDFATLGSEFKKEGFVSSPIEERARLNYGISQELEHSLTSIDGVMNARVHIAIPEPDPLAETKPASSASVLITYRMGADVPHLTGQIKALIVNGVEGMTYNNVTVITVPAPASSITASTKSFESDDQTTMLGYALAGLLLLVGFGGMVWSRIMRRPVPAAPEPAIRRIKG